MAPRMERARKRARGIDQAIEAAGSQSELARILTDAGHPVTQQAVSLWVARGYVLSRKSAEAVERVTGIPRERLAPGLYLAVLE